MVPSGQMMDAACSSGMSSALTAAVDAHGEHVTQPPFIAEEVHNFNNGDSFNKQKTHNNSYLVTLASTKTAGFESR